MKEGLYKVQFQTGLGAGYGVVYAKDGKLYGGDSGLYYIGSYTESAGNLEAKVSTNRHAPNGIVPMSVFGVDKVDITLTGRVAGDTISTTGTAAQAPGIRFQAILTFIGG